MQTHSVRASAKRGLGSLVLTLVLSASFSTGSDSLAAEPADTGVFDALSDIGPVKFAGTVRHDAQAQTYRMSASGTNMWGEKDEFSMLWKRLQGDFIVRAEIDFIGDGVDPHRKAGWIVRPSLDDDEIYVDGALHGDGLISLQYRRSTGGVTEQVEGPLKGPQVMQLERSGDRYTLSVAQRGQPLTVIGEATLALGPSPMVGLFLTSHNPDVVEQVEFSNVRIVAPEWPGLQPYRDYLGSHLEILDLETLRRRILLSTDHSIQAPNWTRDGKALIYNSEGRLYRFELADSSVSEIPSGFATANNNDHVLSWDGRQIAISHHNADDDDNSTIYVMPIAGSAQPRQVTAVGAGQSYLHGFSPDDQQLVFTGNRSGQWNIVTIGVHGGAEFLVTATDALDDGAEYSPDGRWIYFNSTRTGTMQIWRVRPDGSQAQQITFDAYNDWFPHLTPDGKDLVFLSYAADVEPTTHPFYRQVYLRRMSAEGGEPEVIAYLYGGQGTINVHSFSPDGKQLAFVSNTGDFPEIR
jgi:Tol biopolymer transport system component